MEITEDWLVIEELDVGAWLPICWKYATTPTTINIITTTAIIIAVDVDIALLYLPSILFKGSVRTV